MVAALVGVRPDEGRNLAVFEAADRVRAAEEEAVVDREVAGEGVLRVAVDAEREHVAVLLPHGEVLAVVESDPPVLVVSGDYVAVQVDAVTLLREEEAVARVVEPEDAEGNFPVVAVLVLLVLERLPVGAAGLGVVPDAVLDVVKLDELGGDLEAEASHRLCRGPELYWVRDLAREAAADDVVVVVPTLAAVAGDGQLEQPVEEVRFRDGRLVRLDARAGLHHEAPLLPGAAEAPRVEKVEVRLAQLDHAVHGIDGARADADHEVAGVLLGDLVDKVTLFGLPVLRLAALDLLEVVLHAVEVAEVLEAALALLRLVGQHRVAWRERDLAAYDFVLRIVVAAYEDAVDGHWDAFLHRELEVDDLRVGAGRELADGDVRVGERLFARSAEYLHLPGGVRHGGRAGDVAGGERLVRGEHRVGGILLRAGDGHAPDLVLHALDDLEPAVDLALGVGDLLGEGDRYVKVAAVAVVGYHLVARLREVLLGGGRVAEPAEGIPPGVLVEGRAEIVRVDGIVALEREVVDLPALALGDVHRHAHGAGRVRDRLEAVADLHVGEELLLVGALHAASRRFEVSVAVRVSVLQLGERGDLRHRPVVVARHAKRPLEPQLGRDHVRDVYAPRPVLRADGDVLVLAGVSQRADVARALLGVVIVANLHLAPSRDVAGDVRAVGHLHRDGRHFRRLYHPC